MFSTRRVAARVADHRRREVEHLARRWSRESELCRVELGPPLRWVRRDADERLAALIRTQVRTLQARHIERANRPHHAYTGPVEGSIARLGEPLWIDLWMGPESALQRFWILQGRLEEHAVPAARPLVLEHGPEAWVAFEVPAGSQGQSYGSPRSRSLVEALDRRGLAVEGAWRQLEGDEGPLLGPLQGLTSAQRA